MSRRVAEMDIGKLRDEILRQRRPRYIVAAEVGAHPARFGRWLNEREPMPQKIFDATCEVLRLVPKRSAT